MKNTIKRICALFLALVIPLSLSACGNSDTQSNSTEQTSTGQNTVENTLPPEESQEQAGTNEETQSAPETEQAGSNALVVYFSLAGEQYGVGVIEEGNTSIIAHMIAEQTGADLFEIEPVIPYPETHSELLDVSRQEMAENARPEIAGTVENMADYDTVFIGFPNWWGDMPMIVYHFWKAMTCPAKRSFLSAPTAGADFPVRKARLQKLPAARWWTDSLFPAKRHRMTGKPLWNA